MDTIVLVAVAIICVCIYKLLSQSTRESSLINEIPGPPTVPILGNAWQFRSSGEDFFAQLIEMGREWGGPGIARLWIGPWPMVVLTKAETVESLFSSTKHISKASEYDMLHPWLGTGLLTSTGTKWHTRRKLLTPTFHFKILVDFLQVFNEQANIMVAKLDKMVDKAKFDIFPYITLCALDIICDTAMGRNVNAQANSESEYVKAVYKIGEIIQQRMKKPWWRPEFIFYNIKAGKEHQQYLKLLHAFTRQVIEERSAELDAEITSNTGKITMEDLASDKPLLIGKKKRLAFLDMLLVAAKSGGVSDLTHNDIQEEVDTFMFEGHDTTAAAMSWATHFIGAHADVQDKLQDELDTVLGDERRPVTMEDISKLKYLDCVIKEALRLFPSVPFFGRQIAEDFKVDGYTIPKGTSVLVFTFAVHRDPKHFPDPETFNPDRWLPENSAARHPFCHVPFSAGLRNCIGQKFAMNEEKVLLASIFHKFRVTSLQKRDELHPIGELILRPNHGIQVTITRRH